MGTSSFGPHAFFLIDEYDAYRGNPGAQSNFLAGLNQDASYIEGLRALRAGLDAASKPAGREANPQRGGGPRRRRLRAPRRPRVAVTHPRNRSATLRRATRYVGPTVIVIFFRLP
ncbi:hypothetical protein [Streptomyces sp. NPDC002746]